MSYNLHWQVVAFMVYAPIVNQFRIPGAGGGLIRPESRSDSAV